jgi:hypothetical protein
VFSVFQLGIAISVNSVGLLAALVGAVALIHYVVIPREEQYLDRKFGAQYLDYKAAVRPLAVSLTASGCSEPAHAAQIVTPPHRAAPSAQQTLSARKVGDSYIDGGRLRQPTTFLGGHLFAWR